MMLIILQRIFPDPDRLAVIVTRRELEALRRNQDVVKELEADVDTLFAAVLDLANHDLVQIGSEDQHPEADSGMGGAITWPEGVVIIVFFI